MRLNYEKKIEQIITLIDKAIQIAENKKLYYEKTNNKALLEMVELTNRNLREIKQGFVDGSLLHSEGGTLGLTRNIGEWCEDELFDAAHEIDQYFKHEMK
jgi:hypothetical protein